MRLQTPNEERLNTLTHALGAILGVVGFVLLILKQSTNIPWSLFSSVVYGLSIIILFSASAGYHAATSTSVKARLRILDHVSIYILIAGTYTPVVLLLLADTSGWLLFFTVWGIAGFGTIIKLFFTGRFEIFSTLLYLLMGWLVVFDYSTLALKLGPVGEQLLMAGGLAYTIGIMFYAINKIPYNHVIWHLFVLAGAICHFFMVYGYVV